MSTTSKASATSEDPPSSPIKLRMPNTPDVPQEIVDLIIDNLQDDSLSLRSCALTAHAWVHRSRRHLHARIRVGEYYIDLDRYSDPQVAQYVRELDVYMIRTSKGRQRKTTPSLWKMVERFPNLSYLILRDFEFYRLSPQRHATLATVCSQLKSLELQHVFFADPEEFLSFMDLCSLLRHLAIFDLQFYSIVTVANAETKCKQRLAELQEAGKPLPGGQLRSLSIGQLSSTPFETTINAWLEVLARDGALEELTISKDAADQCAGVLQAVGTSTLDLRLSRCGTSVGKPSQTGIEKCPNLRSLTFVTVLFATSSVTPRNQSWIVPFLQQIPPPCSAPRVPTGLGYFPYTPAPVNLVSPSKPTLSKLTFELHWSDKPSVDVDFLTEVDHILSSRQDTFGSVKEIVFIMRTHLSPRLSLIDSAEDSAAVTTTTTTDTTTTTPALAAPARPSDAGEEPEIKLYEPTPLPATISSSPSSPEPTLASLAPSPPPLSATPPPTSSATSTAPATTFTTTMTSSSSSPPSTLAERTWRFKVFLRNCLGTHLKGVLGRPGCDVTIVFPNDGDIFKVEAKGLGEECKH